MFSIDDASSEARTIVAMFTTDGLCGTLAVESYDEWASNWNVMGDLIGKAILGLQSYVSPLTSENFDEFVKSLREAVFDSSDRMTERRSE